MSVRKGAYGVVASIVSDVIPMRSWIRKLSGAERRNRQVQEAIAAGIARRSYLKGIGQARGCSVRQRLVAKAHSQDRSDLRQRVVLSICR